MPGLRIIALLVLSLWSLTLPAQDAPEESVLGNYLREPIPEQLFEQENWEKAKEGIDYFEDMRLDRYDEDFSNDSTATKNPEIVRERSGRMGSTNPVVGFFLKFLLIAGAIGVVAMIIAQFLGGGGIKVRKNRKIGKRDLNFDIVAVEEKLIETDLDGLIRMAEEENNFSLALRLQYLAGIKSLALYDHIQWKKAKTNRHYYSEIQHSNLKEKFKTNTEIFERIWYGDSQITLEIYNELKPEFRNFTKEIETAPTMEKLES